jgi:hypothetical protein
MTGRIDACAWVVANALSMVANLTPRPELSVSPEKSTVVEVPASVKACAIALAVD